MEIKNIEIQDSDGNVFYPHTNASVVKATDTSGLDGIAGQSSDTQTLLDKLADRVANKLIEKGMIVDNFATQIKGLVPDATLVTDLNNRLVEQNNNINGVLNAKIFASNVDDIFTGGCYNIIPSTQGTLPKVNGYALLFVRTANTTWVYQDLIYTDINFKHYHRMNINNAGWTEWEKYTSNSDLQWEVVTHNTEPSNYQVDGKTLFKVEYTANKQIVGFAPMQPNLIIHGIYRNSAEIDYLIVTNSSGENIPNIEINVKVLFANFS